jgi:membrane protease YdiL (CAAX protease family)
VAEELVFRSAVLGIGLRRTSTARAVALSSFAFGCWHVRSARRAHEANAATATIAARAGGQRATVAATVIATTAAGVGFALLRLRTRSVVAPIIVHAALNAAAFAGARAVHGRRSRR